MSETAAIYETKYGDYLIVAFNSDRTFCDSATAGSMAEAVDMATVMRPAGGKSVVMRAVSVVYEQAGLPA